MSNSLRYTLVDVAMAVAKTYRPFYDEFDRYARERREVMSDPIGDELVFDARRGEAIYAVECAAALVAVAEYMGFSSAIDLVRVAKDYGADTPEEVAHVIETALANTESIQNAWTILESNYLRARQLDWDEDE